MSIPKITINLQIFSTILGILKVGSLAPFIYLPWSLLVIPFIPIIVLFIRRLIKMIFDFIKDVLYFFSEGEKK